MGLPRRRRRKNNLRRITPGFGKTHHYAILGQIGTAHIEYFKI